MGLCFFSSAIIRMNTLMLTAFLALWASSFINTGILEDQKEAQTLMQFFSTFGTFTNIILIFTAGKIADKFPYRYIMGITTLIKIAALVWFLYAEKPNTLSSYLIVVLL
jgi:MFS family permease